LAKAKEKRYLELQRVPLINWKDFVLFYRGKQLMKNFITYLFLLFFLSGCGYTKLKMPTFDFVLVNDKEHLSLEKYSEQFTPSVGRFKKDVNIYYPNYNTQYYPVVNPPYIETYLRAKEPTVKEFIKTPVVAKPVDNQLKKEVWHLRRAPRRSKRVPALTKKEK